VAQYAVNLWDSLKYEVLNSVDEDIASEACLVLGGISRALSFDLTVQAMEGTPLMVFIFAVIEECNRKIQDSQQRNIKQAMEILFYVASASPFAFHLVLKGVLPPLQTVLSDIDALTKKRELLKVIHRLLDARIVLVKNQYESGFPALSIIDGVCESVPSGTLGSGGLSFFRDDLFEIFAVALTRTPKGESSLRIVAVQGLVKLVMLPSLLAPGEVGMIIQHLNDLVLDMEDLEDELKEQAILGLLGIGRHYPQHIADVTFPAFLSTVPDNLSDGEDDGTYFPVLRALAKIASPVRMLYELFNRRLLAKLDVVILHGRSQKLAHTVLSALLIGIKQSTSDRGETDLEYHDGRDVMLYQGLVETLYRRVTALRTRDQGPLAGQQYVSLRMLKVMPARESAKSKASEELKTMVGSVEPKGSEACSTSAESGYTFVEPDDFMLELIGNIALVATRAMTVEEQVWAAKEIFTLFMRTDNLTEKYSECSISENGGDSTEMIDIFYDGDAELRNIQTSLVDAPLNQKRTLVLSMHLMCGLYPGVSNLVH
jgi:RNAPII transcription regulator C-terminal